MNISPESYWAGSVACSPSQQCVGLLSLAHTMRIRQRTQILACSAPNVALSGRNPVRMNWAKRAWPVAERGEVHPPGENASHTGRQPLVFFAIWVRPAWQQLRTATPSCHPVFLQLFDDGH